MSWFKRFAIVPVLLLLFASIAAGAPMSESDAVAAARGWLSLESSPFDAGVRSFAKVECYDEKGLSASGVGAMYYVVYLDPKGIIIIPADDLLEPITAFLPDAAEYVTDADNPVYKLVAANMIKQIQLLRSGARGASAGAPDKWAMLVGASTNGVRGASLPGIETIQEIVVAPLLKTKWDQSTVVSDDFYVYNYYTPNHWLSGCTATATSQIMKFFEHPKQGIGVHEREFIVDGVASSDRTRGGDGKGGPYRWSLMPDDPETLGASLTDDQRESIGALLFDVGISIKSKYNESGTASMINHAANALVDTFGYSNAIGLSYGVVEGESLAEGLPVTLLHNAINTNLDAGLPVGIGAAGGAIGGHAFVADGYGYNLDTMYHHMNLGWSGFDNIWYNIPAVSGDYANFSFIDEIGYNIYTDGSGEIASGRVLRDDGTAASGVTVAIEGGSYTATATTKSDGRFVFARIPSNTTYLVKASADDFNGASVQIRTGRSVSSYYEATNPKTGNLWGVKLEEGKFHSEPSDGGSSGCATGAGALVALLAVAVLAVRRRG